jgi:hypothetical protein
MTIWNAPQVLKKEMATGLNDQILADANALFDAEHERTKDLALKLRKIVGDDFNGPRLAADANPQVRALRAVVTGQRLGAIDNAMFSTFVHGLLKGGNSMV